MPIITTLILAAIAAVNIAAVIYIAFLTFREVTDWFRSHRRLSENDRREVGFTLQKRLANGDYNTVQGVFNKETNDVTDVRSVNSSDIDNQLANFHQDNGLVVYS